MPLVAGVKNYSLNAYGTESYGYVHKGGMDLACSSGHARMPGLLIPSADIE
jgi:hypothetical protein